MCTVRVFTHLNLPLTPPSPLLGGSFGPGTEGRPNMHLSLSLCLVCHMSVDLSIHMSCLDAHFYHNQAVEDLKKLLASRVVSFGNIHNTFRYIWEHLILEWDEEAPRAPRQYKVLGYDYDVTAGTFGTSCNS